MIRITKARLPLILIFTLFAACGGSRDEATERGVSQLASALGESCRGDCQDGLFCKYAVGECAVVGAQGQCEVVPEICTFEFMPVCGCDGLTYSNACKAYSASTSIRYPGKCESK